MQAVLKAQINKTDRNDARGIAQMIRVGLYRPVRVKTLRSQKLRMLLTRQNVLPFAICTASAPGWESFAAQWLAYPSRATAHDSGPKWIATPSSHETCTLYSLPSPRRFADVFCFAPNKTSFGRVGRSVRVESRMGAVAWAIRQRSVSHPRSSNRTCPIKASGSPTDFTVRHTAWPLGVGVRDAADRVVHRQRRERGASDGPIGRTHSAGIRFQGSVLATRNPM
jgi:hypothetical protein